MDTIFYQLPAKSEGPFEASKYNNCLSTDRCAGVKFHAAGIPEKLSFERILKNEATSVCRILNSRYDWTCILWSELLNRVEANDVSDEI